MRVFCEVFGLEKNRELWVYLRLRFMRVFEIVITNKGFFFYFIFLQ